MVVAIVFAANLTTRVLLMRVGPRPIVPVGMLLAMGGMLSFTGLGVDSAYASAILPGLLLLGLGIGSVMAPSMASATAGVAARPTPASPRRWSTPASRSAARSGPRS